MKKLKRNKNCQSLEIMETWSLFFLVRERRIEMIYVDINEMIKNASDELKEAIKLDNDFFWDSLNDDQKTAIRIYFREYAYGLDRKVKDNKFSKKDKDEIITRALRYVAWDKRKCAANYCLMGIYKDKSEHISYMLEEAKVLEQEAEKYAKHGIK